MKKKFFRPQNYNFYPAAKNRPEISISGQIMVLYVFALNWKNDQIWENFDFKYDQRAEISAESWKIFFPAKKL